MRKKSLTVNERQIQITAWFKIRIENDNWDMASIPEIAQGIGMSPSSHLRKITDGLVVQGVLVKETMQRSGRWDGWGYKPVADKFADKRHRTIKVNSHKSKVKQTELFSW